MSSKSIIISFLAEATYYAETDKDTAWRSRAVSSNAISDVSRGRAGIVSTEDSRRL